MGMRLLAITLLGLLLGACASSPGSKPSNQPRLTKDARLEFDPNDPRNMPAGTQYEKTTPEEWAIQAAAICARPDFQCLQTPLVVTLLKPDGSTFQHTVPPPIMTIQNGGDIYIMAGQTLHVEADVVDGKLTGMRLVDTVVHPEKTLTVKLYQDDKNPKEFNMVLIVHNPFDRPLKYSAGMMVLDGPDGAVYATDTCPVMAKIDGVEGWPMPIFQLILTNFHLLAPDDKKTGCDY